MAKVTRMRPKRHDVICESIQLILDLPLDLPPVARDSLADALGRFAPPGRWGYVMLNPDQLRFVTREIKRGPRPMITFAVWNTAISYLCYDTGEIMACRGRLAQDTDLAPEEVSRAMTWLLEVGAIIRISRGRYKINPHVGWAGSLYKREAEAKGATKLRLVDAE